MYPADRAEWRVLGYQLLYVGGRRGFEGEPAREVDRPASGAGIEAGLDDRKGANRGRHVATSLRLRQIPVRQRRQIAAPRQRRPWQCWVEQTHKCRCHLMPSTRRRASASRKRERPPRPPPKRGQRGRGGYPGDGRGFECGSGASGQSGSSDGPASNLAGGVLRQWAAIPASPPVKACQRARTAVAPRQRLR